MGGVLCSGIVAYYAAEYPIKFFNSLGDSAECTMNGKRRLEDFIEFYTLPGNTFLNPKLEKEKAKLVGALFSLSEFINISNFDAWPYNQIISDFTMQLRPELLRDTLYRKMRPQDRKIWDKLFQKLQALVDNANDGYSAYRKLVKQELHV